MQRHNTWNLLCYYLDYLSLSPSQYWLMRRSTPPLRSYSTRTTFLRILRRRLLRISIMRTPSRKSIWIFYTCAFRIQQLCASLSRTHLRRVCRSRVYDMRITPTLQYNFPPPLRQRNGIVQPSSPPLSPVPSHASY